jgi:acyl-CoA synthetase (AMP-forming)/AMP-acid ligase II
MDYFLRRALGLYWSRTALVADGVRMSYGALDSRSSRLAAALRGLGLQAGDRVAVLRGVEPAFFEVEIACAKAGVIKVPLNTRLSSREIMICLSDCAARAAIVSEAFVQPIADARADLPDLKFLIADKAVGTDVLSLEALIEKGRDDFSTFAGAPEAVYSIRYSGGTTGEPKGIVHTHGSYVAISLSVLREYEVHEHERALQVTHPCHGANFTWPALLARGLELHLLNKYDPGLVLKTIEMQRLTRVPMVPSMWYGVLDHPQAAKFDLSSVVTFAYVSAPMATERVRQAVEFLGPRFMAVYSLSESAVVSTVLRKQDLVPGTPSFERRLASSGREAEDVMLRIVDDDGLDVKPGEVGEVILSSPGNMLGYLNKPDLSAKTLRDGWVFTGDMGRRDEDGFLYLVDRRNDMIITGGFNVFPREVEDVLYQHAAVREAVVMGIPDPNWGEAVTAFVALHPGANCSESELQAVCSARLAHYKKPKSIRFLAELPKTAVGKIARRELTDAFWSNNMRRVG